MKIQTAYNGKEYTLLTYKRDGFCKDTKTIFEFHGCWWHGCDCQLKRVKTDKDQQLLQKRRERTESRSNTLRSLGYKVVEIFECEWMKKKRENGKVKLFLQSQMSLLFYQQTNTSDIIDLVKNNQIFGAIECDIRVPDTWSRTDITPYDYFSEFCPIFRTCTVDMNDIGSHMQQFMIDSKMSANPRKTLVAGMSADKILLATPLLKFIIDHGLIVTEVYKVIEFEPKKCFDKFINGIADDRRMADKNLIPPI